MEILKHGESQNVTTTLFASREEAVTLQSQESSMDRAESPKEDSSGVFDGRDRNNPPNDDSDDSDDGNDTDGHDSLRSLFSGDPSSTDTTSSLEGTSTEDKELADNKGGVSERVRVGDCPDIPIVSPNDVSPTGTEACRGFDERISLSCLERRDVTSINHNQIDSNMKGDNPPFHTDKQHSFSRPDHTLLQSRVATEGHRPRGRDETDRLSLESHRSGCSKTRKRITREEPVNVKVDTRPNKIRATLHKGIHAESIKQRNQPNLFAIAVSDASDSEDDMTSTAALRSRGNESIPQPSPSTSQYHHPRQNHQLYSFSDLSADEFSSERNSTSPECEQRSTRDDRHQTRSEPEEVVWEYGRLLDYKIVDGKSYVLVPWRPTWEPTDEYLKGDVARVRRRFESRMRSLKKTGA